MQEAEKSLPPVSTDDCEYCSSPENIREVRPFHWLLLAVLAVLYAATLLSAPDRRTPAFLVPFTALMAGHALLHWLGPYLTTRRRWLPWYFVLQGGLVVALSALSGSQMLAEGLLLALCGEAVGILEDVRVSAVVVAAYLGLSGVVCVWLWGWAALPAWLMVTVPLAFFVAVYVGMFIRQAKARVRAQSLLRELETAHRQLAAYAAQVEELTLAAERQRMARELHDTLSQGLSGLILQLEAADSYLSRGNAPRAQAIITQAMARARAALAAARRAIDDLRTVAAADGNLAEAVAAEADRFTEATGIPCGLDLAIPEPVAEPNREHVLRAIAEGLTNIARHARAEHAWVRVAANNGMLEATVRDDGIGCATDDLSRHGHYGLLGLRERARLAGGTLDVASVRGSGTTLTLRLPLAAAGDTASAREVPAGSLVRETTHA